MYSTWDYAQEAADESERRYAYDFDAVLRGYMMRTFRPFPPVGRAVEVGCDERDFAALLARFYTDLAVGDVLESPLARTQERVGTIHAIQGTVESIDPPAATFDAAFLIHVLDHLDDPVTVLRRIGTRIYPICAPASFWSAPRVLNGAARALPDGFEMSDGTTL
jgi:2-polyprenyl-3-methyl-5-hydroxy-6-metoxy-1,4-benzoquinol methylase